MSRYIQEVTLFVSLNISILKKIGNLNFGEKMNIKLFVISITVETALSFGLTGCCQIFYV